MKIEEVKTRTITTIAREFSGDFSELPEKISFGQAGYNQPEKFKLKVTEVTEVRDGEEDMVYATYALNLSVLGPNKNTTITAYFGYPYAPRMNDYDYGHGYWGLIHEAPKEVLKYIGDLTGIDLPHISVLSREKAADKKAREAARRA